MPLTKESVLEALKVVKDPEIRLGIVDMGLIYDAIISEDGKEVRIKMTLTTPTCPYGPMLVDQVREVAQDMDGVETATVDVVWDPRWDPKTMASDEVKDVLGLW
jgi:metal-sulfur cluster biosynthetic enzyme